MSRKDLVKEIVATAAPIFIKKALHYLSAGKPLSEDDITAEVIAECEEIAPDRFVDIGDGTDHVQYVGPYGDLVATLCMIIDDLANDIKSQVAQELMMKMHVELERMKDTVFNAKLDVTSASKIGSGTRDQNQLFGGIPQFDVTDDVHLDTISTGYSSIEKYAPSAAVTRLEDNPLFAMVSKSVDRARAGLSTHSAEDLNEARRGRFSNDEERLATELAIINAEKQFYDGIDTTPTDITPADSTPTYNTSTARTVIISTSDDQYDDLTASFADGGNFKDIQDDVSTNDNLWDKMFAEKYGSSAK